MPRYRYASLRIRQRLWPASSFSSNNQKLSNSGESKLFGALHCTGLFIQHHSSAHNNAWYQPVG